jgi:PKD repeat protein
VVTAAFIPNIVLNSFAPVQVNITNTGSGATAFNWTMDGASPATATDKAPQLIQYNTPGQYRILLEARNSRGQKDTTSRIITVLPPLSAGFEIVPSFDDDDFEAPLTATLHNQTISATTHQWTAPGGILSSPTDSMPTITYNTAGTYSVTYTAANGKQTQTITKTITVKPNSGIRRFNNVQLGINTAQNSIGCFFSTRLRQVFKQGEVNAVNGSKIDIVFFGLSSSFNYNKFISPDSAAAYTLPAIPGATATRYINTQEQCGCGTSFTAADFNAIQFGSELNALAIPNTPQGGIPFSNALTPRIVLFQNAAGKKGAINIKQFVQNGLNSYILCDILVQKD